MEVNLLEQYLPDLSDQQNTLLFQLERLYLEWNEKINLISRKDIDRVMEHHILHALSIPFFFNFTPGSEILDLGTGGGLPGIPLAIRYPECRFTLIDGKGKKIMVVNDIVDRLQLPNVKGKAIRAEEIKHKFDFIVCRAVTSIDRLYGWADRLIKHKQQNPIPNGLIALKGGNIKEELKSLPRGTYFEVYPIWEIFDLPYYEEKYIIYIQM